MMSKHYFILISTLFVLALQCTTDADSIVVPMNDPDTALIITDFTTAKTQLESGGDSCLVSAKIVNAAGLPVENVKTIFVTPADHGLISYPDGLDYSLSDSLGIITATYTTLTEYYGDTYVLALSGSVQDSTSLNIIPIITGIQLTASKNSLLGDGESTVQVSARPVSSAGNVVDIGVNFSSEYGYFEDTIVYTDSTGYAFTTLHSIPTNNDLTNQVLCWINNLDNRRDSIIVNFLGITVELTPESDFIQAVNDSTTITALVRETTSTRPIPNKLVTWNTTLGQVGNQSITDINGITSTTLHSNGISGSAQITADIGNGISGTAPVIIVHGGANQLELQVSESSILANGEQTISVTAFVSDVSGNGMSGIGVNLSSDVGEVSSTYGVTDDSGFINFELLSPISQTDMTATISGSIVGSPEITDEVQVLFRGVTVTVETPDPNSLFADGISTLDITAFVFETTTLNPVVGQTVTWTTTIGDIDTTTTTNVDGFATTTLHSVLDVAGTSTVTAFIAGEQLSSSVFVNFIILDVTDIAISQQSESILADGISTDTLYVWAYDDVGGLVVDAQIRFTTDAGLFSNNDQEIEVTTDITGRAFVVLTSQPGISDITAHVNAVSIDNPSVSASSDIEFRGITVTVDAQDVSVIADGISSTTITARFKESTNGNPLSGKVISWATSLGIIEPTSITDETGTATTILHSEESVMGTATVSAIYGLLTPGTTTVEFIEPQDPQSITLYYNVGGAGGGTKSLTLNALLTDINSYPIPNYEIVFSILQSGVGYINPSSDYTDENGQATVQFTYPEENTGITVTFVSTAGPISDSITIALP